MLGVEPDADNNAINRAYRVKRYEARGNEPLLAEIEAAHSKLMFSSLSARLKVGAAPLNIALHCLPRMLGADGAPAGRHVQQHLSAAAPPNRAPSRPQGQTKVSRDVLYADKEQLFPWKPK